MTLFGSMTLLHTEMVASIVTPKTSVLFNFKKEKVKFSGGDFEVYEVTLHINYLSIKSLLVKHGKHSHENVKNQME